MEKVIIIGGGVSGLSVGVFLQKRGFSTTIFEKNETPGGLCAGWERDGFRFDLSCTHLNGVRSGRRHDLMVETGALEKNQKILPPMQEIYQIQGEQFNVLWEKENFNSLLHQYAAPEDLPLIQKFFHQVELFHKYAHEPSTPPFRLLPPKEKILFIKNYRSYLLPFFKSLNTTLETWIKGWKSESLQRLWFTLYPDNYSLYSFFETMAARLYGNSGTPVGGSSQLVERLVDSYQKSGGELICQKAVDEILFDGSRVRGVRCGRERFEGVAVVATGDLSATLGRLLKGQVKHDKALSLLKRGDLYYPMVTVCYGLNKKYEIPSTLMLEDEVGVDGSPDLTNYQIEIHSFEGNQQSAPQGQSAILVHLRCDYYYWKDLKNKGEEIYHQYKLMVVDELNACLERHFPGFTDSIVSAQVSTPLTYENRSGVRNGAWRGFAPTVLTLRNRIGHTHKGCGGLFFCGQSMAIGGGVDALTEDAYETAQWVENRLRTNP